MFSRRTNFFWMIAIFFWTFNSCAFTLCKIHRLSFVGVTPNPPNQEKKFTFFSSFRSTRCGIFRRQIELSLYDLVNRSRLRHSWSCHKQLEEISGKIRNRLGSANHNSQSYSNVPRPELLTQNDMPILHQRFGWSLWTRDHRAPHAPHRPQHGFRRRG